MLLCGTGKGEIADYGRKERDFYRQRDRNGHAVYGRRAEPQGAGSPGGLSAGGRHGRAGGVRHDRRAFDHGYFGRGGGHQPHGGARGGAYSRHRGRGQQRYGLCHPFGQAG